MTSYEEGTPTSRDLDYEEPQKLSKSRSPALAEPKKFRDDYESSEDLAKQYKKFRASAKYNLNSEELFCICREPDHGGELMISCDGCEEWFHFRCMRIAPANQKLMDKFFCKFCAWKGVGVTRWNRKCRRPYCLNPIRKAESSKYCSDDCAMAFFKSKLQGNEGLPQLTMKFLISYAPSHERFSSLGTVFPEPPEVSLGDRSKFPSEVQAQLLKFELKIKATAMDIEYQQLRSQVLGRMKDFVKIVNEEVTAAMEEPEETSKSKKKKAKTKKVDLCCYNKSLNSELPREDYEVIVKAPTVKEAFKDDINTIVQHFAQPEEEEPREYPGPYCLNDRRKCLRHNGWLNLMSDQVWKRTNELQILLQSLENESSDVLRSYSIQIYENRDIQN